MVVKIRKPFYVVPSFGLDFSGELGESMTKQEFKSDCDLNFIMKRYVERGILPDVDERQPIFGDFTDLDTYQNSLNTVIQAQTAFDSLSSEVRARFENDPSKLMAFLADSSNKEEAQRLGLIEVPKVEQPLNVPRDVSSPSVLQQQVPQQVASQEATPLEGGVG